MKIRLHTRFSLLIIALILVLVGVLSGGLLYQVRVSMSEIRGASKEAVGEALFSLYRTRFLGHKFVSCGGPE